jgi:hypothetical protein
MLGELKRGPLVLEDCNLSEPGQRPGPVIGLNQRFFRPKIATDDDDRQGAIAMEE